MKRFLFFIMLVSGIITFISGVAEGDAGGEMSAHIVFAVLFAASCVVHLTYNRKVTWSYIKGKKTANSLLPQERREA